MCVLSQVSLVFLLSVQQVIDVSVVTDREVDIANLTCIYHDEDYLNCTWKRDKEGQSEINATFYYWLSDTREYMEPCAVQSMNTSLSISCKLRRKVIKSNNRTCLYIRAPDGFTILSPTCFFVQGKGLRVLTIEDPNTTDLECNHLRGILTCKLEQGHAIKPPMNYTLHYWSPSHAANWKQCSNYTRSQSLNIGCHVESREIKGYKVHYVYVIDSNNFTLGGPRLIELRDIVQPNPPLNMTAQSSDKEQISLSWDVPKNQRANRLEFEIQYQSDKDSSWREVTIMQAKNIILPSIDLKKCYMIRVRSKVNKHNALTSYWSEWTPTLIWKNNTVLDSCSLPGLGISSLFYLIIIPVTILDIGILICVIYNFKRIKALLFPSIPDTKRIFADLYKEHNGNFQEWIGSSNERRSSQLPCCSDVECVIHEVPEEREKGQEGGEEPVVDKPKGAAPVTDGESQEERESAEEAVVQVDLDMSKLIMNENMYVML